MQKSWIDQISQCILKALAEIKGRPALIIEGLDFLLAAGPENISPSQILTLLSLLSEVYSSSTKLIKRTSRIFISVFADHNLLPDGNTTDLTQNHAVLVTSLLHRAYSIISLRPLQTGTAKDVHGVMRMTRAGAWYDFPKEENVVDAEEWEMLYRIDDGKAKLFKYA
jgi:elongator complex protein 6